MMSEHQEVNVRVAAWQERKPQSESHGGEFETAGRDGKLNRKRFRSPEIEF